KSDTAHRIVTMAGIASGDRATCDSPNRHAGRNVNSNDAIWSEPPCEIGICYSKIRNKVIRTTDYGLSECCRSQWITRIQTNTNRCASSKISYLRDCRHENRCASNTGSDQMVANGSCRSWSCSHCLGHRKCTTVERELGFPAI